MSATIKSTVLTPERARALAVGVMAQTVHDHSIRLREAMQASMRWAKHGRLYKKPDGRLHRASAPGEPPAVDTGRLHSAFTVKVRTTSISSTGTVSNATPYAMYLEKGTKRMAPRPYAKPAFTNAVHPFVKELGMRLALTFQFKP